MRMLALSALDRIAVANSGGRTMREIKRTIVGALSAAAFAVSPAGPVAAGDYNGDFMARVGVTVVHPDSSADVFVAGALLPGGNAEVSTEVIPSLTLTYFLNKNIAAELFCCFARPNVEGKGVISGLDLGDTWIFPPAVTLQYHFDPIGAFKPYVGAGVQYIAFFGESVSPALGTRIQLDDAFGFTLQAGVDIAIGGGWYLNADVKRTWLDTDADWGVTGLGRVTADVDVDPWLFTAAVGYRFNLSDVFGRRNAAEPLK